MAEPEWVIRSVPLIAEEQKVLPASGSRSRRRWELELRNLIIGYLWFKEWPPTPPIRESTEVVKEFASKFNVSPRTMCRILVDQQKTRHLPANG